MSKKPTYKELEQKVKELKKEADERKKAVKETNITLNVLLKKREKDKSDLEEKILSNVEKLIEPYLEKLKKSRLNSRQEAYLNVLESNLKEIVSPFQRQLSLKYHNLTPKEIQIASLIKQGKTTNEIAKLLGSTTNLIAYYRKNISNKLGLRNKKTNI